MHGKRPPGNSMEYKCNITWSDGRMGRTTSIAFRIPTHRIADAAINDGKCRGVSIFASTSCSSQSFKAVDGRWCVQRSIRMTVALMVIATTVTTSTIPFTSSQIHPQRITRAHMLAVQSTAIALIQCNAGNRVMEVVERRFKNTR